MADHAHSTPTPIVSRRCLAGVVLLPLTSAAVVIPATQPDAELIALCARIDGLEELLIVRGLHDGLPGGPEEDEYDELVAVVWEQQKVLADRVCALPCTSPAGLYALSSTIAAYRDARGLGGDMSAYPDGRLLDHLLCTLTRDPSGAGSGPVA